ncbi:MAG: 16S rRNA (guanine(966)-N(2))-methyltransferase RsmD [Planctomycetota bacterium]|jgi:16S rRNA (guanine966-N2)-methyltransferase
MLRVTSGSVRGFKVEVPRLGSVRPPLEMLREAIFNILGQDLSGWRVADLFAGCGIMGIEALSRGAEFVLFVEKNRTAAAIITRNLEKVRLLDRARVVTGNAFRAPRHIEREGPIDLVFIDPPFRDTRALLSQAKVLELVGELLTSESLSESANVILRLPANILPQEAPPGVAVRDQRVYGNSRVVFFEREPIPPGAAPEGGPPEERAEPGAETEGGGDAP